MIKAFLEIILSILTVIAATVTIYALGTFLGAWGNGLDNILYEVLRIQR